MDALLRNGPRKSPLGLVVGAYAVIWGFGQIASSRELRKLMMVPLGLLVLLYVVALLLVLSFGDDVLGLLWSQPESTVWWVVWWVAAALLMGAAFLVLLLLFTTLAELVGGPFYDKMAIHVLNQHQVETEEPSFWDGTVFDLVRSLVFPAAAVSLAVLALVPGIGVGFAALATGAAWLGFASGAVNPSLLVTKYSTRRRLAWLGQYLFTGLGLGSVVSLAMLLPLVGLISIPASIVGAAELHAREMVRRSERRTNG